MRFKIGIFTSKGGGIIQKYEVDYIVSRLGSL